MTLIKSVSGVRGIVFDDDSEGLSTLEIIHCVNQFLYWIFIELKNHNSAISIQHKEIASHNFSIALGRDGRLSGKRISNIVIDTIKRWGFDIVNLDLTTTPSVQLAIISENCIGGIMISASHNPIEWNGLKLLNFQGEFLSKEQAGFVFNIDESHLMNELSSIEQIGNILDVDYKKKHVASILDLDAVDVDLIKSKTFKVVVDGINSSGGVYVPFLLEAVGVEVIQLNCVPNGHFQHNPEPIPQNLSQLCNTVKEKKADFGIAVDPDVDRLVLVCEDGSFFGEEYTIVCIANYILNKYPNSNVVSNLSTTKAVKDIANKLGAKHFESAVGEINVVELMKKTQSIIGGEGSGGVIFAPSHYGRDALVGIALFLTYLAKSNISVKSLRLSFPNYFMVKEKIATSEEFKLSTYLEGQRHFFKAQKLKINLIDGIKIYYPCGSWAHLRHSNTEPIIRLIIESNSEHRITEIKKEIICGINNYLK